MNPFSKLHPVVIFSYYIVTLILLIRAGHPFLFFLLFVLTFLDYGWTVGAVRTIRTFFYSIGAAVLCLIINPLLNHRGVTLLFYLGDTRITKEAVAYGGYMALLLLGTLFLFSCFSEVMTSEKIMTLAGSRFPSFALLFSMILRIVPKVKKDFREMTALHGNRPKVWSALVGKLMEDSVERSMAMKNKGYGSGKRTSCYKRNLIWQDVAVLGMVCLMAVYVVVMQWISPVHVRFFPSIRIDLYAVHDWILWIAYLGLPLWMRGKGELAWLLSRRRITGSIMENR